MTSMLYVGNLGMQTTEDQLAQSFASFGCAGAEVISTGAYSDDRYCGYEQDFSEAWKARRGYRSLEQYRHSRGFGFVYFSDEGQMEQAFAAATPPNLLLLRTGEETEPRVLRVKKYTPQSLRTSDGLVEHSEVAAESMMQQRCPKPSRRGRGLRSGAPRTAPRRRTKKEDAADDEQSLSSLSSQASSSHLSATAASWTPFTELDDADAGSSTLRNQITQPQDEDRTSPQPVVHAFGHLVQAVDPALGIYFVEGGGFACL